MGQLSLVRIYGDTEPKTVIRRVEGWDEFEKKVVEHLREESYSDEDGLFFIDHDDDEMEAFSHGYMVELRALAGDRHAAAELEGMVKDGWEKKASLWKERRD